MTSKSIFIFLLALIVSISCVANARVIRRPYIRPHRYIAPVQRIARQVAKDGPFGVRLDSDKGRYSAGIDYSGKRAYGSV